MPKVLIADDEYLIRQFLKKIINWEKMGLEWIGEASNGIEAFQLIQQLSPDIVIADIRMPGLSGLELLEKCSQMEFDCHFVIISGYPDFEYVKTAFVRGAVNYILKPIDEIELEETLLSVRNSIEMHQNNEEVNGPTDKKPEYQPYTINYKKWDALRRLISEDNEALSLKKINQLYGCCFKSEAAFNIAISNISMQDVDGEMNTISSNLNSKLEEQFRQHVMPLCYECQAVIDQEKLLFLLNYEPSSKQDIKEKICTVLEKLHRSTELINARITVGLGSGKGENYYLLYQEAVHALECRYVDKRLVIVDGDTPYIWFNIYDIMDLEWENHFFNMLDSGNESGLKHILENVRCEIASRGNVDPKLYLQAFDLCSSLFRTEAKRLFHEMFDERKYLKMLSDALVHSRSIQELFGHLIQITLGLYHECIGQVELAERWPVVKAKQYIEEHYSEKIVLKDLANKFFINADYFSSIFKKDVGIGFNDYLRQYRVTIAQQLIRSGKYSLEQVAEKVGYMDPKHFSKSFKKTLGVSPAEYKKFYKC